MQRTHEHARVCLLVQRRHVQAAPAGAQPHHEVRQQPGHEQGRGAVAAVAVQQAGRDGRGQELLVAGEGWQQLQLAGAEVALRPGPARARAACVCVCVCVCVCARVTCVWRVCVQGEGVRGQSERAQGRPQAWVLLCAMRPPTAPGTPPTGKPERTRARGQVL
jgi:hypothetical protein